MQGPPGLWRGWETELQSGEGPRGKTPLSRSLTARLSGHWLSQVFPHLDGAVEMLKDGLGRREHLSKRGKGPEVRRRFCREKLQLHGGLGATDRQSTVRNGRAEETTSPEAVIHPARPWEVPTGTQ